MDGIKILYQVARKHLGTNFNNNHNSLEDQEFYLKTTVSEGKFEKIRDLILYY